MPEVGSGIPSPPPSPPFAANSTTQATKMATGRARRGGAAFTIAEECERLFCETLRSVFLGEGNTLRQDSLAMGMHDHRGLPIDGSNDDYGAYVGPYTGIAQVPVMDSPPVGSNMPPSLDTRLINEWVEVWDYVGGIRFRGFIAEKEGEKTMFVFFDQTVMANLKAGLMALLELCAIEYLSCSRLIIGIDRDTDQQAMSVLSKDLGWIGFQLTNLDDFAEKKNVLSEKWVLMEMDT